MQDMCFKRVFDTPLKTAVRFNHSLDELLEHADVKEKWEKCSQMESEESGEAVVADSSSAAQVVTLVHGNEAHPLADQMVSKPVTLSDSDEQLVTEAEKTVMTTVQSLVSTINFAKAPEKGDTSEKVHSATSLASLLRSLPVVAAKGTPESSVLLIYDVEAAGEQSLCPRRSACPLRKDHLETVLQSALIARADDADVMAAAQSLQDGDAEALAPDQSDVNLDWPVDWRFYFDFDLRFYYFDSILALVFSSDWVPRYLFFDGGRPSLHQTFNNSFKAIGGLKWKHMYLAYSEQSCLDLVEVVVNLLIKCEWFTI